jgi:hypothetical protein
MSNLGVTGSRNDPSDIQKELLYHELLGLRHDHDMQFLHNGGCIGADEYLVRMAYFLGYNVITHPPVNTKFASRLIPNIASEIKEPKEYLVRNRNIVDATDYLLAAPSTQSEILRSGTWATIRYARKLSRPMSIIYPDGTVER